ncbi:hypothetical protein OSB04_024241 [Centaurea solstitialis]|uniref:Transposase n=1 Tax=Centaurea solstitialis TaxID=347529 RepID=A0AA38WBV9_9ASTR|nr:hypothetical protein OSB04_024241 [Centaurea solstitialis]
MSYAVDKVKLILRSNGEWVEGNEEWFYVCTNETVEHRVKLYSNFGELKVVYKHDGELLMLTDDEHVSGFMEFSGNSRKPPILFVYADYSMCDGGGTSNTRTQEGANESQMQLSNINPTNSHDHTYGLNDYYPKVVPETQQQQEGQQQPDDEEEDRTTNRGCANDESHVFNLSFAGIALDDDSEDDEEEDDEEDEEGVILRGGVNDYFEMPVFVPTPEVSTTTNQTVPYNRSSRIKKGQVFETKNEMIIELGIKCLQEGFKHQTHRSTEDRANRAYRPPDIVDDINQQFGLSLGYANGWRARWNALDSIKGSHSESFTRLPAYLYNLELTNPGTQTSKRVDSKGHFEECFVALSVAIHTFLQNLRRVLIIDAAHLKGPYLGTMFLVVAMYGNNNIVPIAFGVGRSETAEEWTWCLSMLKRCIDYFLPKTNLQQNKEMEYSGNISEVGFGRKEEKNPDDDVPMWILRNRQHELMLKELFEKPVVNQSSLQQKDETMDEQSDDDFWEDFERILQEGYEEEAPKEDQSRIQPKSANQQGENQNSKWYATLPGGSHKGKSVSPDYFLQKTNLEQNKEMEYSGNISEAVFVNLAPRRRDASINAAITAIFPNSHHALCCRHLVMNVRSRYPRIKVFKTPYWKACKAYTTYVFDRMMNILRVAIPDGAQLMEEVGVDRWSRAYFPGIWYNIMTSNSVESINAMARFARRLPIVGLNEYFRAFQQEWYIIRRAKAGLATLNNEFYITL